MSRKLVNIAVQFFSIQLYAQDVEEALNEIVQDVEAIIGADSEARPKRATIPGKYYIVGS